MSKRTNESGYILIGVLAVFTILSILGVTMIALSATSFKTSSDEKNDQSAFYIAEAGLNYKYNKVEKMVNSFSAQENTDQTRKHFEENLMEVLDEEKYDSFEKVNNHEPLAKIQTEEVNSEQENFNYKIKSTGEIGTKSHTVEQIITVKYTSDKSDNHYELSDMVAFVEDSIELLDDVKVRGTIGTLKKGASSIKAIDDIKVVGEIWVPKGYENMAVIAKDDAKLPQAIGKDMPAMPKLPNFHDPPSNFLEESNISLKDEKDELRLIESRKINKINVYDDSVLNIDIGDNDIELVVDQFIVDDDSSINLKGSGTLTLHVTKKLYIYDDSKLNDKGEVTQLDIFYSGKDQIVIDDDSTMKGSLFIDQANLLIKDDSYFYGNIFSGGDQIKIIDDNKIYTQLLLAPKAKLTVEDDSNIYGQVIAKEILLKNDVKLIHEEPFVSNGPISPGAIGGSSGTGQQEVTTSITSTPLRVVTD